MRHFSTIGHCIINIPPDCSWQLLYWKFVLVDRREKIVSGQRTTSFSYLLNDQRGVIGKSLAAIPPKYREAIFMGGQLREYISAPPNLATKNHPLHSLCHSDGASGCIPFVQEPCLEWILLTFDLCGQCLERWRILHRGFRPQVRIAPLPLIVC